MDIDWKDALGKLAASGALPQGEENSKDEAEVETKPDFHKASRLKIVIDRKGRKGKTATIIEGFQCTQEELEATAQLLKKKIGTGGSARGGEILLQGEWAEKARQILLAEGFRF